MLKLSKKDVKTPYLSIRQPDHAVNGVANCRETRDKNTTQWAAAQTIDAACRTRRANSHVLQHVVLGCERSQKGDLSSLLFYMNVPEQIRNYIASQPEQKRTDMQALHRLILKVKPRCKLWFLDGKNSEGKIVSNPNIGYGAYTIKYADGTTREFYQIGLSANKTGISVYIMGIEDKKYLAETFGNDLGKASVTGYCIRFKILKDINIEILEAAIRYGFEAQNERAG